MQIAEGIQCSIHICAKLRPGVSGCRMDNCHCQVPPQNSNEGTHRGKDLNAVPLKILFPSLLIKSRIVLQLYNICRHPEADPRFPLILGLFRGNKICSSHQPRWLVGNVNKLNCSVVLFGKFTRVEDVKKNPTQISIFYYTLWLKKTFELWLIIDQTTFSVGQWGQIHLSAVVYVRSLLFKNKVKYILCFQKLLPYP